MIRRLVLTGLASATLVGAAAGATAATTHHNCGALGPTVGAIKATNMSCTVARKVVRADVHGKRYTTFHCTSRPNQAGANITCHSGQKKVTFQVAD
jgi:hypothetical protein